MKINNNSNSIDLNFSQEKDNTVAFGIRDQDMGIITEILRKRLYGNPIQTLVQEYLCNARDAHREVGKDSDPVRVTLPTYQEPVLKIRDFGPGISPERIRTVFCFYGASPKRENNKQTGGYGIGAKSAWAYTDSFTVVTYVDGICYSYAAVVGQTKTGELILLSESKTDEPNGTEIQIPISSNVDDFRRAVFRATMFWDAPPVFTNRDVEFNYSKIKPLFQAGEGKVFRPEDLSNYFSPSSYYELGIVAVVDGIPYSLSGQKYAFPELNRLKDVVKEGLVLVIDVPNGAVDVSATREKISDGEISKNYFREAATRLHDSFLSARKESILESKSLTEFIDNYKNVHRALIPVDLTYVDSTGVAHTISKVGVFSNNLTQNLSIKQYSLNVNNGRLSEENQRSLSPFDQKIIYNDSKDDSYINLRKKIKLFLNKNSKKSVLVVKKEEPQNPESNVSEGSVREFILELGGVLSSALEKPVVVRGPRKPRNKNLIKVQKVNGQKKKSKYEIDLSNNQSQFIFLRENHSYLEHEVLEVINYSGNNNLNFCILKEKDANKIASDSNFVDFECYISKMSGTFLEKSLPSALANIYHQAASVVDVFIGSSFCDDIQDQYLKNMVIRLREIRKNAFSSPSRIPAMVHRRVLENIKQLEEEKVKSREFVEYFSSNYPAVSFLRSYDRSEVLVKEIIFYLNAKYKDRTKTNE